MWQKRIDLTGQRFGMLTVVSFSHVDNHGKSVWNCLCDCGKTKGIITSLLRNHGRTDCGCQNKKFRWQETNDNWSKRLDLTGKRFGRLTVLSYSHTRNKIAYWNCKCDCGTYNVVRRGSLVDGGSKSCGGCVRGLQNISHGMSKTETYKSWLAMKRRCNNSKDTHYKDYGGRGIAVCPEWNDDFVQFLIDMGERPKGRYSIDRIDNSKGYSKENCRWATDVQQAGNRRDSYFVEHCGRKMTLQEWANELGVSRATIKSRLDAGRSIEEAFSQQKLKTGPK